MRSFFKSIGVPVFALALAFNCQAAFGNFLFGKPKERKPKSFFVMDSRSSSQCAFSPMATKDAAIALGVNLDRDVATKVFDAHVDKVIALLNLGSGRMNEEQAARVRRELVEYKRDPFKDAPPEWREFLRRSGLRDMELRWAVLSIDGAQGSAVHADSWLSLSLAIAGKINLERLFSTVTTMSEERRGDAVTFRAMTVSGEKAWRAVQVRRGQMVEDNGIGLYVTMLDDQLLLLALTRETLERQILLYREGMLKGDALQGFSPGNGDVVSLFMSDVGKNAGQILPTYLAKPFMPLLTDLNTLEVDMWVSGDETVQTITLEAKSEADAKRSRARMEECLRGARTNAYQDPDVPKTVRKMIERVRIRSSRRGIRVFGADLLSFLAASLMKEDVPQLENRSAQGKPNLDSMLGGRHRNKRPGNVSTNAAPSVSMPVEDDTLTAAQRAVLDDLQEAIDDESFLRVARIVKSILAQYREGGDAAIPPVMREQAVEALGWFLPDSLAELIGFMADSNPEVLEDVMKSFTGGIDDADLSDRELANIFKKIAPSIKDDDAIDAILMGLENDMRNSVAVDTYKELLKTGSDEIKLRLVESIQDFTGEDDITTPEQLDEWLKKNPDDEEDEEFYGNADKDAGKDDDKAGDKAGEKRKDDSKKD